MRFTISNERNDIEKAHPKDIPFKVRLGDIQGRKASTRNKYIKNNPLKFFKLRMLKNSLKKEGYNPTTFGYIALTYDSTTDKYNTFDGNHRISVLKDMYDDDYEIEAIRHLPCEDCGEVKWDLNVAHTPIMIFFVMYALLPTIVLGIIFYITYFYLPDFKLYTKLHKHHPVNGLKWVYDKSEQAYSLIMNVFYNINNIINVSILLCYVIWILYGNFYICMIAVITQLVLTQTLKYLKLEELKYSDLIKKLKFW